MKHKRINTIVRQVDELGHNFIQIIETMIGIADWFAPLYNAKDPAELLLKFKTNEQK